MSSLNRIVLLGKVSEEVSVKVSTSGDSLAVFSLSVDRPYRQDGSTSVQDLFKIIAWRQQAEQASTLKKGDLLLIEGRIQTRKVEEKDGAQYLTEIEARDLHPLSSPQEVSNSEGIKRTVAPTESQKNFDFEDHDFGNMKLPSEFSEDVKEELPF